MRAQARTLKIGDIELKLGTKVPCKLSEMQGILSSPGEDAAASVLLAFFFGESRAPAVRSLLEKVEQRKLAGYVSAVTLAELVTAFLRKHEGPVRHRPEGVFPGRQFYLRYGLSPEWPAGNLRPGIRPGHGGPGAETGERGLKSRPAS